MRSEPLKPVNTIRNTAKKASNRKRNIAIVVGLVVLALIISVYVMVFTSPEPQQVYQFHSLQERQTIAGNKFNEIQRLTVPPTPNSTYTPQRAEIVLSEVETNAIVQMYVDSDPKIRQAMDKLGVQNPTVHLKNNSVDLMAKVRYSGVTVPVTLNFAVLQGMPNTMKLAVNSATIGRMPVTGELRQKLTDAVNHAAPGGQFQLPKGINSLRVESGRLVVVPDTNPASPTTSTPLTPPYTY